MSAFKDLNYIKEFSLRTMLNYLYQKSQHSTAEEKINIENKIFEIKQKMKVLGYVVEDYYEVTALINSLIGLLVFPEQNSFKFMSDNVKDLQIKFPSLYSCTISDDFINTYNIEETTPKNVIKHMKNALSHERVMFFPMNSNHLKENKVSSLVFKDVKHVKKENSNVIEHFDFSITIPIEKFEMVIMEIAEYLYYLG